MRNSTKWLILSITVIAVVLFTVGFFILTSTSFNILGSCLFSSGLILAGLEALGLGIWDLMRS